MFKARGTQTVSLTSTHHLLHTGSGRPAKGEKGQPTAPILHKYSEQELIDINIYCWELLTVHLKSEQSNCSKQCSQKVASRLRGRDFVIVDIKKRFPKMVDFLTWQHHMDGTVKTVAFIMRIQSYAKTAYFVDLWSEKKTVEFKRKSRQAPTWKKLNRYQQQTDSGAIFLFSTLVSWLFF